MHTHRALGMTVEEVSLLLELLWRRPAVITLQQGYVVTATLVIRQDEALDGAEVTGAIAHADLVRVKCCVPINDRPRTVGRTVLRNNDLKIERCLLHQRPVERVGEI